LSPSGYIPAEPHLPGNGAGRNPFFHCPFNPVSCTDYNYFVAQAFSHLLGFPPVLFFDDMFYGQIVKNSSHDSKGFDTRFLDDDDCRLTNIQDRTLVESPNINEMSKDEKTSI